MPVIKSAIKKLKQDKKRERKNDALRADLKSAIRTAKKNKSGKAVSLAVAVVDKAAKNRIIHTNNAARLKSTLSKIAKPTSAKTTVKVVKKTSTKPTTKKAMAQKKSAK